MYEFVGQNPGVVRGEVARCSSVCESGLYDSLLLGNRPSPALSHRLGQEFNPQRSQNNDIFRSNPREHAAISRWSEGCTVLISEFSL